MKRALLVLSISAASASCALSGCVTTAGAVKKDEVSLPLLAGAAVGDLVVVTAGASTLQDTSFGGALVTGLAITALDLAIGCLIGACSSLRL